MIGNVNLSIDETVIRNIREFVQKHSLETFYAMLCSGLSHKFIDGMADNSTTVQNGGKTSRRRHDDNTLPLPFVIC